MRNKKVKLDSNMHKRRIDVLISCGWVLACYNCALVVTLGGVLYISLTFFWPVLATFVGFVYKGFKNI
jgi:hypothetical protein